MNKEAKNRETKGRDKDKSDKVGRDWVERKGQGCEGGSRTQGSPKWVAKVKWSWETSKPNEEGEGGMGSRGWRQTLESEQGVFGMDGVRVLVIGTGGGCKLKSVDL